MIETQVKPLSSYFDEILESCIEDCEIGGCDREGYDYCKNSIYFENDDYMIEGEFYAAASTVESGDGYWTPRETTIVSASAYVGELSGSKFNPETEDYDIDLTAEEISALEAYLDKNLADALKD